MKKINLKAALLLCIAAMFIMSLSVGAVTPRDMKENGEVSDGSVVYGDKRDGIVSDVSSEMSDIGGEISEFVETVLPGADSTPEQTSVKENADMTTDMSTQTTSQMTDSANGSDMSESAGAVWGIAIAVIVAIAVIALIFFFVKRK